MFFVQIFFTKIHCYKTGLLTYPKIAISRGLNGYPQKLGYQKEDNEELIIKKEKKKVFSNFLLKNLVSVYASHHNDR